MQAQTSPWSRRRCAIRSRSLNWAAAALVDFLFILLIGHGGGLERSAAARSWRWQCHVPERPFHPDIDQRRATFGAGASGNTMPPAERRTGIAGKKANRRTAAANRQLLAQIEEREKVESTLRQMQRLKRSANFTRRGA